MSDKAREYVITGNEEYLEDYGVVAAALQDTEDRLQHMEDAGATEVELATLTEAIDQANRLTNDQRQAIKAPCWTSGPPPRSSRPYAPRGYGKPFPKLCWG